MVARTPQKLRKKMVLPPLNSTLLRETVNKVDKCMERLQELQYIVAGGEKVVSGEKLSPRSTRGYLKTSFRCKQESLRIKNANPKKSSPGKLPAPAGEWRRMSLPAMLVGETVGEILQASQFAREIVGAAAARKPSDDPKTPLNSGRKQPRARLNNDTENSELRTKRRREKQQIKLQAIRKDTGLPVLRRARSKIIFKASSPPLLFQDKDNCSRYLANRVSPKHKPWAKKTVLFPNPLFHTSPTSNNPRFSRTKSPIISQNRTKTTTPHKFLIKTRSPPRSPTSNLNPRISKTTKSPTFRTKTPHKFLIKTRSPPRHSGSPSRRSPPPPPKDIPRSSSAMARLRRSFSPSRFANRLISPMKTRKSLVVNDRSDDSFALLNGSKERPAFTPVRFSSRRI